MQNQLELHEKYMRECLELAKLADGCTSPNPLVGSVVLDKNGKIAGRGYHKICGLAHAEVNSLNEAGNKAEGGTIYVNLEPCFHQGRTPPCIDRIIKEKIAVLVIGMTDPNPKVAGKSIEKARNAGITVIEKILEKECLKLNEIFVKNITENKPFISIKTASTMDGKIATSTGSSKWITSEAAREEVQDIRNRHDAIITGSNTVIKDNPSMTCRKEGGKNPVRIVIDSNLATSPDSKIYDNDGTKIIIATSEQVDKTFAKTYPEHVEILFCPLSLNGKINLEFLVENLHKEKQISSILIESGGNLNAAFLEQNLVDKIYFFLAPKLLGDKNGVNSFEGLAVKEISECKNFQFGEIKSFAPDIMIEGYLK